MTLAEPDSPSDLSRDTRRPGTLWVLNLDWPVITDLEPGLPVHFAHLDSGDVGELAQAMNQEPRAVLQRFEAGRECYAFRDSKSTLAAYAWVSFEEEEIGEMQLRIQLRPGEAYIWDCATLPAFRQQHLYASLLVRVTAELRAQGFCRVWIGTAQDNVPSQKGVARAGFRPVADLVVERVIGLRRAWVYGREGVPDSIVADARYAVLGDRDETWRLALTHSGSIPMPTHHS